jgi:hypothetical protein
MMNRTTTVTLLLALCALSLAGCDAFNKGFRKGYFDSAMESWADKGDYGGVFTEFRKDFPTDYADLKKKLADKYSDAGDEAAVSHEAFGAMRTFIASHMGDLANAPDDDLVALAQQQRAVLTALKAENIQACADLSMSAIKEDAKISKPTTELIAKAVTVELHAVRDGIDHPTPHPAFTLSAEEQAKLRELLQQRGIMVDPRALASAPAAVQCEFGLAILDEMLGLPKERTAAFQAAASQAAGKAMRGG